MSNDKNPVVSLASIEPINWGTIRCCECDDVICYYPPETQISEDSEFEFYCFQCAAAQKWDQ